MAEDDQLDLLNEPASGAVAAPLVMPYLEELELDLTDEPLTGEPPRPPTQLPYDPRPVMDRWRGIIASALLGILLLTIAAAFATLWWSKGQTQELQDMLKTIAIPLFTLVGTVTGFYFATRD